MKDKILSDIITREGGYVYDPEDSGGETNYGITVAVARRYGYSGSMKALPYKKALEIYEALYWSPLELDYIEGLSEKIAAEMADTGVNMGIARAGEFLQRSLNAVNYEEKYYPDLLVDGRIGRKSLNALHTFLTVRGSGAEETILKMLNSLQGAFYISLAERRPKDRKFVVGWFKRV